MKTIFNVAATTTFIFLLGVLTVKLINWDEDKQIQMMNERNQLETQLLIEQQKRNAIQNELNYWKSLCPGQ